MKKTASLLLVALTVLMLFPLPSIATFEPYDLYATEPVNMRSGPGTQYEVIMELQTGESVFCFAKSGSWLEVAYYGKTGYVHSKYLSRERMLPGMILAAKTNANVRSGAGTSYSRVGKLKKGESLTYLGVSGKWYQVEYHGKTAYVHKSSVKFVQFDGEHVYLTLDDSKFFDNHYRDVYLGDYYDVSRRRVILVSGNANVQQLSDDVANLCGTDVDFVVKVSQLPIEMNKDKGECSPKDI